jgi:Flp pilus assembly protein TadD
LIILKTRRDQSALAKLLRQLLLGLCFFLMLLTAGHASSYVGGKTCSSCHQAEYEAWQGSHHDMAMQPANEKTVLGNFDDASLTKFGVKSLFYKKNGKFMVRTEGPQGTAADYEIRYTFGVAPLQQYLVDFPGGRMQALSLAWDARPEEEGGQRWFHLYPDEKIAHDDELHWTSASQNWNNMCAECHSTNLEKNYDPVSRTFSTSWSEIDVSCEACHGPGSDHLAWAKREQGWEKLNATQGLALQLDERKDIQWPINSNSGNAKRSQMRTTEKEIEMCARCHSRRSTISKGYVHGERLMDHYRPQTLDEGMYFVDGQIQDEVYVYGSFVQSKMYHEGVTCSDCHEPHTLALKAPGNGVCLKCHAAVKYDQPEHHFHKKTSPGASCAECHMPPTTYMAVDPRHDHNMRIPRPDLSVKLDTPNACNNCHQDKDARWAEQRVKAWYGDKPKGWQTYAPALHAARVDGAGAGNSLAALIREAQTPDIARATALSAMGPYLNGHTIDVLPLALSDDDPLVRSAAVEILDRLPLNIRVRLAFPMLEDPVRAVRIEAARTLAGIPAGDLPAEQRALLDKALQEFITAQQANAERPETQTNLGNLYAAQGKTAETIAAYNTAIELDIGFIPAYVNLADFYRLQGNETQAEKILRRAIAVASENAAVHHALGLSLIRQKRTDEALQQLQQASKLDPDSADYIYIYAVGLYTSGKPEKAVSLLQEAQSKYPQNRDILNALVAYQREQGNETAARNYARKLQALTP